MCGGPEVEGYLIIWNTPLFHYLTFFAVFLQCTFCAVLRGGWTLWQRHFVVEQIVEVAEKSLSIDKQIEVKLCVLAETGGPVLDRQPHTHKGRNILLRKLPTICVKMKECAQKVAPSKQLQSTILTRNCHGSHALATINNLETVEHACCRLSSSDDCASGDMEDTTEQYCL